MTICVVDDERPIMQLCVKVLESHGYVVDGYTRGEEALARLTAGPADLLVVDYKMPGLDGVEVVRRARALRPEIRVVMITGHGTREVIDAAHTAGAHSVLLKPFTPNELAGAVAAVLGAPSGSSRRAV
ncbi:MAG: response regulator [Candidatus Rokubacteria bacterium]|nr:response regulator [Candidatus Rokubacteria bacterium]